MATPRTSFVSDEPNTRTALAIIATGKTGCYNWYSNCTKLQPILIERPCHAQKGTSAELVTHTACKLRQPLVLRAQLSPLFTSPAHVWQSSPCPRMAILNQRGRPLSLLQVQHTYTVLLVDFQIGPKSTDRDLESMVQASCKQSLKRRRQIDGVARVSLPINGNLFAIQICAPQHPSAVASRIAEHSWHACALVLHGQAAHAVHVHAVFVC
jgi:hypothetical protein